MVIDLLFPRCPTVPRGAQPFPAPRPPPYPPADNEIGPDGEDSAMPLSEVAFSPKKRAIPAGKFVRGLPVVVLLCVRDTHVQVPAAAVACVLPSLPLGACIARHSVWMIIGWRFAPTLRQPPSCASHGRNGRILSRLASPGGRRWRTVALKARRTCCRWAPPGACSEATSPR
jgi:hypothetical protein